MKRLGLLIAATVFLTACGAVKGIIPMTAPAEVKPKTGDTVLYKQSREGFLGGVVESAENGRYKIRSRDSINEKEESDVYLLPKKREQLAVKAADMVVAKMEDGIYWSGAEVLSVEGDVIKVKELSRGKTMSLSPDKIMTVRPAAVAEFQKLKAENEFSERAKQARPRAPAGFKPKVGDRVVAQWMANVWYEGEIAAVEGEKATIKWPSFKESVLGFESIMPYPKAESAKTIPPAGSYVLVKPEGGTGQWTYAQVVNVSGDSAEVKSAAGKTRVIKSDEYIALN